MSIVASIVLGLIAGCIGSKLVNKTGEGFFLDIALGIDRIGADSSTPSSVEIPAGASQPQSPAALPAANVASPSTA